MALARIQTSIVKNLLEMGRLSDEQFKAITETKEEMSGETVELLLAESYKVSQFQLLCAKAKAFDLSPINIKNCIVNDQSYSKLDQEFCQENGVLPLGFCGEFIIVAVSNPFNLQITTKIQEASGMKVSVLLGLESQISKVTR